MGNKVSHVRFIFFCLLVIPNIIMGAGDTLTLLAEDDAVPWSYPDGSGCANEIVIAAYRAVDVTVSLLVLPYARCKKMVVEGVSVGCFSMAPSPDLAGKIRFPKNNLFVCQAAFLQRTDHPVPRDSLLSFAKKGQIISVGAVIGYEYPPLLDSLRDAGLITLDYSRSEILNLKKLDQGRIDLALTDYNEFKPYSEICRKAGIHNPVSIAFMCGEMDLYIGYCETHPRTAWAIRKFEEGYNKISENGSLKKIKESWTRKSSIQ